MNGRFVTLAAVLVGSGGVGAAISQLDKDNTQPWAFAVVIALVVVGVILVGIEFWVDERKRETRLESLSGYYTLILDNAGELLVERLRYTASLGQADNPGEVLGLLANELRAQEEKVRAMERDEAVTKLLRTGTASIAERWDRIGAAEPTEAPAPVSD